MRRARLLVIVALVAALGLSCLARTTPALARQRAVSAGEKPKRVNDAAAELNDSDSRQSEMRGVIERYVADRGSLFRFFGVEASPARRMRLKKLYDEWLATISKLDFDSMSEDGRIDYILFKNHLDHELRQLDIQEKAAAEIAALTPFAGTITDLEDARCRMEPIDSPKTAALLTKLSKQIDATSKAADAGPKPDAKAEAIKVKKAVANRAVVAINTLRTTLKNWYTFYNGYDREEGRSRTG